MWIFEPICCDGCNHFSWNYFWIDHITGKMKLTDDYPTEYYDRVDRYAACAKGQKHVDGLPKATFCKCKEGKPFITYSWFEHMLRY
jgi:hypothetical protein